MERDNSTTNTILVILLVIVVGFVVWYVMGRNPEPDVAEDDSGASLDVNLGGSDFIGGGTTTGEANP